MVRKKMLLFQLLSAFLIMVSVLMSIVVVKMQDAQRGQALIVQQAEEFYKDKLYMRAINTYQEAVRSYTTPNNPTIERGILQIYKEAGKTEEYYELIKDRIEERKAEEDEYMALSQLYVDEGNIKRAIETLQIGMKQYESAPMKALYEEIRYDTDLVSTNVETVKCPQDQWYIPYADGSLWGYMDSDANMILTPQYEEALPFTGNYAVVKIKGVYTLIDRIGDWYAIDKIGIEEVTGASNSYIVGKKNGKYGIYTNTFQAVTNLDYADAVLSTNGLCFVKQNGLWGVINCNGESVLDFAYDDVVRNSRNEAFASGYAVVKDASGYFIIDEEGKPLGEFHYADAKGMEGGLLAVADKNGKWGFTDGVSETVIKYQYEDAHSFSDSIAAVKKGGEWGYISKDGKVVIEVNYEDAMPFYKGESLVKNMGLYEILTLRYYEYF